MINHDSGGEHPSEPVGAADDAQQRALTEGGNGEPPARETTPLYDLTAAALAAAANPTPATEEAPADGVEQLANPANPADPPAPPPPLLDPDTPEGAAIMRLFRQIKNVEEVRGDWNGGDVVDVLSGWFTDLGIDPDTDPLDAGRRLRLALRDHPGGRLFSATYGVRIGTDNTNPDPIIRAALRDLAAHLGPGTGIDLVGHDRAVHERFENPPAPATG